MKRRSNKDAVNRQRKFGKRAHREQPVNAAVGRQVPSASAPALKLGGQGLSSVPGEYDEAGLARVKTQWIFGEWGALAELDLKALCDHPDRARFALLAASAHQQLGDQEKARMCTRLALEWGCPQRLVAEILVAGVHNTLGRAAALKYDDQRTTRHFHAAVAAVGSSETTLISHARAVREMARMGLLPQAASLVDKELQVINTAPYHPRQRAHMKELETEIELLRHELSLALQRQQLFASPEGDGAPMAGPNNPEWLEALKKRSVSQLGQDLWVLKQTGHKHGGFFVEFGATDGVLLSNTWLLEKEFGWSGICAEPNPRFFEQLKQNRGCTVSDACIGARSGEEVEFVMAGEFSGMRRHATLDNNAERRSGYLADERCAIRLRTISLNDFLIGLHAPRMIDYLSIDTEGSEFEILASFPFDDWQIRLLTVEHNFTVQREMIHDLLASRGYSRIEAEWDDWYYLNGSPQ